MGLGLQGDNALDGLHAEPVGCALVGGRELLHHRSLGKGHVVLVGGEDLAAVLLGGLLDHLEEARLALLAVDDKRAAEDLVAAVLGVDLREAKYLRVGERPAVLLLYLVEIFYFLRTQGQSFLLVVLLDVLNVLDGLRRVAHGEDVLVQPLIHALQHRVEVGVLRLHGEVLLYTRNALETHVLSNLNGICTPRCYHLTSRTHEESVQLLCVDECGVAVEPAKGVRLLARGIVINLRCDDVSLLSLEE